jgi:hypothetical protein
MTWYVIFQNKFNAIDLVFQQFKLCFFDLLDLTVIDTGYTLVSHQINVLVFVLIHFIDDGQQTIVGFSRKRKISAYFSLLLVILD